MITQKQPRKSSGGRSSSSVFRGMPHSQSELTSMVDKGFLVSHEKRKG